ncbi:MAG: MATE family efflux transporter, partial [Clostridiales bacterium]|nr:MATE family efflux transporter [Clostridiales bacterium]
RMKNECFVRSGNVMKKVCSLGISSFIQQFAIVLIMAVTNNVLVIYGARSVYGSDIPLTTIGITMKVNQILIAAVMGMASGAQPIFGYNYGNQQVDRVKKTYRLVLTASTIILIIAFLIFQFKPMSIVRLFGSESDLYNEFAVKCFRIFLLACPLNGCQMVTSVFFQAIGKPKLATVLSLTRQVIFFIPAALLLPLALGVEGVLWTGAFADSLAFVVSVILIKRNWKKL